MATAYPLQWPHGWPREKARESSRLRSTLPSALAALKREVALLGGTGLVLSSNATLGNERPADPAVCAYFTLRGQGIAIPCDRWQKIEDNVKAIALTIEAMRGMERWGAKNMITAMFKGFKALPEKSGRSCWEVLGLNPETATEKDIIAAYRNLAQAAHPDTGGSHEAFTALTEAKDLALSTLKHRA